MSMDIKNKREQSMGEAALQTNGQKSLTVAITEAVRERLERVRGAHEVDLAERLLLIGRDCAAHLKAPFDSLTMRT